MDERIISILKAVAKEYTDESGWHCTFLCEGEKYFPDRPPGEVDEIAHEATCPTTLARIILKEQGQPLQVYEVSYREVIGRKKVPGDYKCWLTTGHSAEEIRSSIRAEKITDLQVSYVRDLG